MARNEAQPSRSLKTLLTFSQTMNIIKLNPSDCKPHPLLARMAMEKETIAYLEANKESDPAKEARRVTALEERKAAREAFLYSIASEGIKDAVKAVKTQDGWLIADGRHRLEAATIAGKMVPAMEISEEDARSFIMNNLALRRHMKKSNVAWLLLCLHPGLAERKQGPNSDASELSRGDHAAAAGVSADLVDQAATLWKLTAKNKSKRAQVDAAISAGKSLGGLIAGFTAIAGQPEEAPATRAASNINSYSRAIKTIGTQLKLFADWTEDNRAQAVEQTAAILRGNESARALFTAALAAADAAPEADDSEPSCHTCQGSGKWPSAGGRIVKCPSCKGGTKQPDAPEADAT